MEIHHGKQIIDCLLLSELYHNNLQNVNYRVKIKISIVSYLIIFLAEKGVQICWDPQKNIQTHFIEVIFSNQGKSNGGPIRSSQIFQHLGVAQVFYQNSNSRIIKFTI